MKQVPVRRRLAVVALCALALWLALGFLDRQLAVRAQALIDRAWANYLFHGGGPHRDDSGQVALWRWRALNLEADECNALAGALWLPWLMPRSHNLLWPPGLSASVEGGHCNRQGGNAVIFTVAPQPAGRDPVAVPP